MALDLRAEKGEERWEEIETKKTQQVEKKKK